MTADIIDAEVIDDEPSTELVARQHTQAVGLFGTDEPEQIIVKATRVADVLKGVVVKQGLAKRIGTSEYILVEGWTTLGNLVGVFPRVEYTRAITGDDPGWEAAVVVVNAMGVEIGRAEAQCLRSEKNWRNRDDFALRSMAQTRAMGKALRMPLGWIATLAGYEATPAEEMPEVIPARQSDNVPFEFADESQVTYCLELAAKISPKTHDSAVDMIAKVRTENDNRVPREWLDRQIEKMAEKVAA